MSAITPTRERHAAGERHPVAGVVLRPARPGDLAGVTEMFQRMSPEGRYRRFFQAMPDVPAWLVRRMLDVDQVNNVVWLATAGGEVVGEAILARSGLPGEAEVALSVRDDWQRRGLGRRLVELMGALAADRGIHTLTASVLPDNRASLTLFRKLGFSFEFDQGAMTGRGPRPPWTADSLALMRIRHQDLLAQRSLATAA